MPADTAFMLSSGHKLLVLALEEANTADTSISSESFESEYWKSGPLHKKKELHADS